MGKVTVTATKDFFDGGNQVSRKKGAEFVLREEYAKSLGDAVKIGKSVTPEPVKEVKAAPKKAKDMTTGTIKKAAKKK